MTAWVVRVQASTANFFLAVGNLSLRIIRRVLWPTRTRASPSTVCIYRIGNVGDIICALPAVRAIRREYPESRLLLLTSPGPRGLVGAIELLGGVDWLNEIIVYYPDDVSTWAGRWGLLKRLRTEHISLWVDLSSELASWHRQVRDMFFARLTGAHSAIGWHFSSLRLFSRAQSSLRSFPSEVERLLALVARDGISTEQVEFKLPIAAVHHEEVAGALRATGLDQPKIVAIAPGAKRSTNHWPVERFVEIGRRLHGQGFDVVVLGGGTDVSLCAEIAEGIGDKAQSLAGQLSLLGSCAMLERCRFLVCVDSGVQHMAAAVGTPCLSITSAREFPGKWRPWGKNVVLRHNIECNTCLLDACPIGNACMNAISVNETLAAIDLVMATETIHGYI